ncbi:hypothetical protein [Streptomyces sp. NPDC047990]|uniref:hypothetical protein n=1 Tax=Streptomyces sp. NPDC047990 TaxID=3365496 RepID=UPI00371455A3
MSITSLIPGRRDRRRHSPDTVIRNLRDENRKLLDRQLAADDYFAVLTDGIADADAALEREQRLRGLAEEAAAQMRMERDEWIEEAGRHAAELAPHRAAEANAHPVTVPPMVRPIDGPEEQATAPIDVRPLWAARDAGLLRPVTDPGHVPAT